MVAPPQRQLSVQIRPAVMPMHSASFWHDWSYVVTSILTQAPVPASMSGGGGETPHSGGLLGPPLHGTHTCPEHAGGNSAQPHTPGMMEEMAAVY